MIRVLGVLAIVSSALALSGCAPQTEPLLSTTGTPYPPVFSSRKEAMAAAEEVFVGYFEAVNVMVRSGGQDLAGYKGVVTPRALADEESDAREFRSSGRYLEGALGYTDFRYQQYKEDGPLGAYLQAYFCLDTSGATYINADGSVVNVPGAATSTPHEAVFITDGPRKPFLLDEVIRWTGGDFCSS